MALNLNALKNIPVASLDSPKVENIPVPVAPAPSSNKISLQKISAGMEIPKAIVSNEKISANGPKISLMKLKQDSQGETPTPSPVQEIVVEKVEREMSIAEIAEQAEKNQNIEAKTPITDDITEIALIEEISISSIEESTSISDSITLEIESENKTQEEGEEAHSIFSNTDEEIVATKEETILEQTPSKEFFPNFHISNEMGLDDDILNLNLDGNTIIQEH